MANELTRGDLVVTPDDRQGIIIASRTDAETVVGFDDGSEEVIARSDLRPALKSELPPEQRASLEEANAHKLPSGERLPDVSETMLLPDGEEVTVIGQRGRAGIIIRRADGSETQVHRTTLRSA